MPGPPATPGLRFAGMRGSEHSLPLTAHWPVASVACGLAAQDGFRSADPSHPFSVRQAAGKGLSAQKIVGFVLRETGWG